MNIKYQIFRNENLLIHKFIGHFSIEQYIQYNKFIMGKIDPQAITKFIIDIRDIIFDSIPDDFHEVMDKIIQVRKKIAQNIRPDTNRTIVFWVDKPIPTMIAQLIKDSFSRTQYHYCSTAQRICEIINAPSIDNLEEIIGNLESGYE